MRHKDENKIRALQDAVINLVIQEGYQNLSVAKIAKRAGVSVATLYIYYQDKQDMLSAVYLDIKDKIDGELFKPQPEGLTIDRRFKLMLTNYATAIRQYPKEAAVMRVFNSNPELISADAYQNGMARAQPLHALYHQGLKSGQLRQVSPELLIAFTFQPLDSLADARFRASQPLTDDEVSTMIEMAWAACRQN
ncbi:TetR/AcrR family transcriptional regulator [Secundilactobacillus muriivasis]